VEINQVNAVKLKHSLPSELHEIALKLLASQTGPRQYHQQQQHLLDKKLTTDTTKNNILLEPTTKISSNKIRNNEILAKAARAAILMPRTR
jgi:hypothetical protein